MTEVSRRLVALAGTALLLGAGRLPAAEMGVGGWNSTFKDTEAGFIHAYDASSPNAGAIMDGYFAAMLQYVEGLLLAIPTENDMDALKDAYVNLSFMEWQVRGLIDDQKSDPRRLRVLQRLATQIALAKLEIEKRWVAKGGSLKDLTEGLERMQWRSPLIPGSGGRN